MPNNNKLKHLELALEKLEPRNLDAGLPGREEHDQQLYHFLYQRLKVRRTAEAKQANVKEGRVANIKGTHDNKTVFLCGVPGTGKTATVMCVLKRLRKLMSKANSEIYPFKDVYVNGQHLASPERVYSSIMYQLTKKTMNSEKAQEALDAIFKSDDLCDGDSSSRNKRRKQENGDSSDRKKFFKIVVIDELDVMYNERNQGVFYSLFDWPTTAESRLILIVIANAMDLSERFMRGRIQSRMGWEKILFESYTSDCLLNIVKTRLGPELMSKCFEDNAVKLASLRIGRSTGDARRILDTCRIALASALEDEVPKVNTARIDQVGAHNMDQQRSNYIKTCPPLELFTLKAILHETNRVGEENVDVLGVYRQVMAKIKQTKFLATYNFGIGYGDFDAILCRLVNVGMIYLEDDKPIVMKKLFIKDNSDACKDLISTTEINYD